MTTDTANTMRAALTAMEQSVTALAGAYGSYRAACQDGQRTEYSATGRTDTFQNSLGLDRVDKALAARMDELGLEHVREQPHLSAVGSDWPSSFSGHITQLTK